MAILRLAVQLRNYGNESILSYYQELEEEGRSAIISSWTVDSICEKLNDPCTLPTKMITPQALPDVQYPDIYNYLISTPSVYNKEDLKAYKSLDAYK